MEKYGFVYIWFDRKHKRYYIGSHWGNIDDGYVCSSNWMRDAYKRRKSDFKRKILKCVSTNRSDLFEEEFNWLQLIKDVELGKRYYNLTKHKNGHWTQGDEYSKKTISERISQKTKEAMQRPDVKQKYKQGIEKRDNRASDPEIIEKKRQSMKITMAKKFPVETRKQTMVFDSPEYKEFMKNHTSNMWASLNEEQKQARSVKIQNSLVNSKERRSAIMKTMFWWTNGTINKRHQEAPGPEWFRGRV